MGHWHELVRLAEQEVAALKRDLPPPLRERAEAVEIVFDRYPSDALVDSGIEPDSLGLFEGDALPDGPGVDGPWPTRVFLFLENIWDEAEGQPRAFRSEVRITLLHEWGHYLGLDEDALADRDLE